MNSSNLRAIGPLIAVVQLLRPINGLAMASLYGATRAYFSNGQFTTFVAAQSTAWLLASAAAYAFNDLLDVRIDRTNHPSRPLPSGRCSKRLGEFAFASCLLSAVLLAFATCPYPWVPLGAILLSLAYSLCIRSRSALMANITSGVLVAAVPLSACGGCPPSPILWLSLGLLLLIAAREMQKDLLDKDGDAGCRCEAFLLQGRRAAGRRIYVAFLAGACGALLVAHSIEASQGLRVLAFLTVAPIAAALLLSLCGNDEPKRQSLLLKIACYATVPGVMLW